MFIHRIHWIQSHCAHIQYRASKSIPYEMNINFLKNIPKGDWTKQKPQALVSTCIYTRLLPNRSVMLEYQKKTKIKHPNTEKYHKNLCISLHTWPRFTLILFINFVLEPTETRRFDVCCNRIEYEIFYALLYFETTCIHRPR